MLISETVAELVEASSSFKEVYLFGSVLRPSAEYGDIDVLIIYEEHTDDLRIQLDSFARRLEGSTGLLAHVTALSVAEEEDVRFLERVNALRII